MDLTTLTAAELEAHRIAVLIEQERRASLANIPLQIMALADQYEGCGGERSDLSSCVTNVPMDPAPMDPEPEATPVAEEPAPAEEPAGEEPAPVSTEEPAPTT